MKNIANIHKQQNLASHLPNFKAYQMSTVLSSSSLLEGIQIGLQFSKFLKISRSQRKQSCNTKILIKRFADNNVQNKQRSIFDLTKLVLFYLMCVIDDL